MSGRKIKSIFELLDKDNNKRLDKNELAPPAKALNMVARIDPFIAHQIRAGKPLKKMKKKKAMKLDEFEKAVMKRAALRKNNKSNQRKNNVALVRQANKSYTREKNIFRTRFMD
jgi:Ca2+-binding EF-hand superfamily protein